MDIRTVSAVSMDPKDTVVTVTKAIEAGQTVSWREGGEYRSVTAQDPIPIYHKIAVVPVEKGGYIYKYGEKIGVATQDVLPGQHVHVHNLVSEAHER